MHRFEKPSATPALSGAPPKAQKLKFRAEDQPINFGAARALIKKSQAYVADALEESTATIQFIENNCTSSAHFEKLKAGMKSKASSS